MVRVEEEVVAVLVAIVRILVSKSQWHEIEQIHLHLVSLPNHLSTPLKNHVSLLRHSLALKGMRHLSMFLDRDRSQRWLLRLQLDLKDFSKSIIAHSGKGLHLRQPKIAPQSHLPRQCLLAVLRRVRVTQSNITLVLTLLAVFFTPTLFPYLSSTLGIVGRWRLPCASNLGRGIRWRNIILVVMGGSCSGIPSVISNNFKGRMFFRPFQRCPAGGGRLDLLSQHHQQPIMTINYHQILPTTQKPKSHSAQFQFPQYRPAEPHPAPSLPRMNAGGERNADVSVCPSGQGGRLEICWGNPHRFKSCC